MRILPLCVLATLAACDGDSSLSAVDQAATPIQLRLMLQAPVLRPGTQADFVLLGAAPGAQVYLAGSLVGTGPGPCPASLSGACIDLQAPFVADARHAAASGISRFAVQVPAGAPVGAIPCFQGIEVIPGGVAQTSLPVCTLVAPCVPTTVSVDFDRLGTFQVPVYELDGVTVSGSNDVNVLNLNGLGIVGGANDNVIDGAEQIVFTFDGGAVENVTYTAQAATDRDSDGFLGERFMEAFDARGTSYGVVSQNASGTSAVHAGPVSSFTVTADVDAFRIGRVTFDVCL